MRTLHTPGHTERDALAARRRHDVFTGDTLFKGSVGGVRAPGQHELRRPQALDHGRAARRCRRRRRSAPATPTRRRSPTSSRATASCASGAASTPRATEPCTALGEPATLILLGDDYDGGHKAWVRWPDGARRHRARLEGRALSPEASRNSPRVDQLDRDSRRDRRRRRSAAGRRGRPAGTAASRAGRRCPPARPSTASMSSTRRARCGCSPCRGRSGSVLVLVDRELEHIAVARQPEVEVVGASRSSGARAARSRARRRSRWEASGSRTRMQVWT